MMSILTTALVMVAFLAPSTLADQQNHNSSYHGSPPLPVCIGQQIANAAAVAKCLPTITPCPGEGSTSCCQHNGYDYYCCPKLAGSTCPAYANATAWVKTWEPVYTYHDGLFYRQVFYPVGANTSSVANSTTAKPNTKRLKVSKDKTGPKESTSKGESTAKTAAKSNKRTKVVSKLTVSEGKKTVDKSKTRRPKKITSKKPSAAKMKKLASESNSEKVDDEEKSADDNSTISSNETSEEKRLDQKPKKMANENAANNTAVQNNKKTKKNSDNKDSENSAGRKSEKNGSVKSSQSDEDIKILVGEVAVADPLRIANIINRRQSPVKAPSQNSPIIALSRSAPIITLEQLNGDLNAAFLSTAQPELEIVTKVVEFSTTVDDSTEATTATSDTSTAVETTVDSTTAEATLTTLETTEEITLEMLEPSEQADKKDSNDPLEAKFLEDKFQKNSPPATFSPVLRQLLLSHRNELEQATATEKEQIKLSKPAMLPLGFNLDSDAPMTIHLNQSAVSSSSHDSHDVRKPINIQQVAKFDGQSNSSEAENKHHDELEEKSLSNKNSKDLRGWYIKASNMSSNVAAETNQPIRLKMASRNQPITITSEILHSIDKKPSGTSLLTPTIRAALLRMRQIQKQAKGIDILRSR